MQITVGLFIFVVSSVFVHSLEQLPRFHVQISLLLLAVLCLFVSLLIGKTRLLGQFSNQQIINGIAYVAMIFAIALLGLTNTMIRADIRLKDKLDQSNVDLVTRVKVVVTSLPQYKNGVIRFDAEILESNPQGVPKNIQIKWAEPKWLGPYARYTGKSAIPTVKPGYIWKMALVLRPVNGLYNLGGFDYEQSMFAKNIRAIGTVRGKPKFISDEATYSFHTYIQRLRYKIKNNLTPFLNAYEDDSYANMLLALSIGDQTSLKQKQWEVFSRTGITHLVSISGTHVSIISGLAAMLMYLVWTSIKIKHRKLTEYAPAQIVSAVFALLAAWFYCLLAGWGIPAQRTFFMLSVVVIIYITNIRLSSINILLLVAGVITLLDPWAVLSNGFWLSFIAVGVLIAVAKSNPKSINKSKKSLHKKIYTFIYANQIQIVITLALIPVLGVLFNQVSLISPVVNAYAITLVSLVITPLALLVAILSCVSELNLITEYVIKFTVYLIDIMMIPTLYLSKLNLAVLDMANVPWGLVLLAIVGVVYAMLPKGMVYRYLGWLFICPMLIWQSKKLNSGDWILYALDVGQASAIILKTSNHVMLFDAGNRNSIDADSAQSVILPFIRYLGIRHLDALVISHADLDHIGGLYSILSTMDVKQIFTSFDVHSWLEQESKKIGMTNNVLKPQTATSYCSNNLGWSLDGVKFRFVWPNKSTTQTDDSKKRNASSCVLSVQGTNHSVLLTGDINKTEEGKITNSGLNKHDIVLAAHHGSNGSSSDKFIKTIKAKHVIVQSGAFNRYNHPHPDVIKRWQKQSVDVWRNDHSGVISVESNNKKLQISGLRQLRPRYWHTTN